jgi:type II secretory pathway component GspD/PulD (secretin)/tetratricopeptide (TPR) repeat protein
MTAPPTTMTPGPLPPSNDLIRQAASLHGQQLVAEAEEAARAGQYNNAARLYRDALSIDPGNDAAKRGLDTVQGLLSRGTPSDNLVGELGTTIKLRHDQALARYDQAMDRASAAQKAGNYNEARDASALAKAILDTNRQVLSEGEYNDRARSAADLSAAIERDAESARQRNMVEQARTAERENADRKIAADKERDQKVQQLLHRAADLRRELNYEQSLEVLEQVLFIDPNNVAATAMKEMIEDSMTIRGFKDADRVRNLNITRHQLGNLESSIPHNELILYPPDWPQLTYNRTQLETGGAGESEINRRVIDKLQQPIPIAFENNRFENVVEYLRNVTGVNIFVNWRALEDAGIERGAPVTLQLANVPADKALSLILDQVGGDLVKLGYNIDDGVLTISTRENLSKNTIIRTYDIRDLLVVPPTFTDAPQFDLTAVTQSGGSQGGGGGSLFTEAAGGAAGGAGRAELMEQIQQLIRDTVDPENWRTNGGLVSSMSELNGTLIINTTSVNHRDILALLNQLRETRALQINVEARFLIVESNFLDEVGVNLNLAVAPWDWGFFNSARRLDPVTGQPVNATGSATNPLYTPIQQGVLTPASATDPTLPLRGPITGGTAGIANRQGTILQSPFTTADSSGNFPQGISSRIQGVFMNEIQVDLLVRATQANRRNTTLTAPRLTFFNGQRAYVLVSTQTAYVSDLAPVVGTSSVGFDPTVSVISTGVVLDVEGTVSADRRYVTMTVRPSLATLRNLRQIPVQAVAGGAAAAGNGGVATGIIEAPEIDLTTVRTTVNVPDKGTLLLGGQRIWADIEVEAGVPILSKVPILNRFFDNRSTTKDERTLLILIKPTIFIQSEKENELFPGLNQSPQLFTGASAAQRAAGGAGGAGGAAGGAGAAPKQ